jgi:hypothetical protein
MGKTIKYSKLDHIIVGNVDSLNSPSDYTILSAFDSSGCTQCKLHLELWSHYINEVNRTTGKRIKLIFITKVYNDDDVRIVFQGFKKFFVINTIRESISSLSKIPFSPPFNTVLLDKDDKIISIGNPLINNKVKNNYYVEFLRNGSTNASSQLP